MKSTGNLLAFLTHVMLAAAAAAQMPGPVGYDQGPIRQARLMADCGEAHFRITCDSEPTQRFFDQGVAQLHGAWLFEAERSFRQVAMLEPNCAMAYWGMALANTANPDRAAYFIDEALLRRAHASPGERRWIDALGAFYELTADGAKERHDIRLKKEQEDEAPPIPYEFAPLTYRRPLADRRRELTRAIERIVAADPTDLEAVALLQFQLWVNRSAGMPMGDAAAADRLLDRLIERHRYHSAHAYRARVRGPGDGERAKRAARWSVQVGPAVASRWLSSGEVLAALGQHEEAVWYFDAAARLDRETMRRDRVMPYDVHGAARAVDRLCRELAYAGRVGEALRLARASIDLPRHPVRNRPGDSESLAGVGIARAVDLCVQFGLLDELRGLEKAGRLATAGATGSEFRIVADLAGAHLVLGDVDRGKELIARAGELRAALAANKSTNAEAQRRAADRRLADLRAMLHVIEGRAAPIPKLDLLPLQLADVLQRAGDAKRARAVLRAAAKRQPGRVPILLRQLSDAHRSGDAERTRAVFDTLRTAAGRADLRHPAFAAANAVARALGQSADWRTPREPPPLARRPDAVKLGPAVWTPVVPYDWKLTAADGTEVGLEDYRGRPLLVIIYLGFGCLHCVEQLQSFHPRYADYQRAGIQLVSIGLDTVAGTRGSLNDLSGSDRFRFPMLSDRKLHVFHEWLAFDEFEHMPLHGTYLLDAKGRLLWQDLGHEPFSRPRWLLRECRRLLALHRGGR